MKKEYTSPEMKVTSFAAENICTISGVTGSLKDDLATNNEYAKATVSFNTLVEFTGIE